MNVLITGHTRGIGAALSDLFLADGHRVFGLARGARADPGSNLAQISADFAAPDTLGAALDRLLPAAHRLDLVVLNAGVLGPITALADISVDALRAVMDVNVWANKTVLDWLARRGHAPAQIVAMSSGAAVTGHYGWGPYALSKATLNMLIQLYAHELPASHLSALAPGLVDTDMQVTLRATSAAQFPSLERLHLAAGTDAMPDSATAAARIIAALARLRQQPSGRFYDLRDMHNWPVAG